MSEQFKGYPLFNETANVKLQAWNRAAVYFNIRKDCGQELAVAYVKQFDDMSRARMNKIFQDIKDKGYEATKKEVQKSFKFN